MVKKLESKNGTAILFGSLRFVFYFLTIFVTYDYLARLLRVDAANVFREGYFVEWLQYSLIMATVVLYFFGAWRWENRRPLFLVLGMFAMIASIREWDYWWDRQLPFWGWQLPASICLFVLIMIGWRYRKVLPEQICDLIRSAPFGFLWSGFLAVVVLAQLVGHAELLKLVMGSDFKKGYKQIIEESLELFGYYLIWFGTLEALLAARLSSVEESARLDHRHPKSSETLKIADMNRLYDAS
ncbi:hypothetical protein [Methylocaldum szegediense]|uniref:hypothetical protein n=1 Tax=Methylocaldum szegediense TaxID=73780 RepID=UPI00047A59F1|nr:hypothetical protein [Methylocaldum szegediense]